MFEPSMGLFFFDISFRTPLFGGDIHSLWFRKNLTLGIFCLNNLGKRKKDTYHGAVQTPHFAVISSYFKTILGILCDPILSQFERYDLPIPSLWRGSKINEVCTETHGCGGCTRGARWQKRAACPGDSGRGCWLKLAASGLPQRPRNQTLPWEEPI